MTGASAEVPGGLRDPVGTTPPRPTGSVRRTSHIDIEPGPAGGLVLTGAARDLRTGAGGARVIAAAQVRAELDARLELVALTITPEDPRAAGLVGRTVASGFRAAVDEAMPDAREAATPLYVLLDDLPVAVVISGYARLYSGDIGTENIDAGQVKADVCAGWRSDGTMMVSLRTNHRLPVPVGPPANRLEPADDPLAWHDIGPLPPGAMRRRRLVEVTDGDPGRVYAMFRDTHVGPENTETVLHEYAVTAELDPTTLILSSCRAQPRVLPWVECPEAAPSAARLDGRPASELRRLVSRQLRGTTTCTHLNDLLRSLGDLGALVALLPEA
jgi:hypothetical protein